MLHVVPCHGHHTNLVVAVSNFFFFHMQFIEIIAPLPSILQRREEEAEDITIAPQQQTTA